MNKSSLNYPNNIDLSTKFEHKEKAVDNCGLPKDPSKSKYPKHLWASHIRIGGVEVQIELRHKPESSEEDNK